MEMKIEDIRGGGDHGKNSASVKIKGVEIEDGTAEVTIECTEDGLSPAVFTCHVNLREQLLEEHEHSKIAAIGIGILLQGLHVWRNKLVELQKRIDESVR